MNDRIGVGVNLDHMVRLLINLRTKVYPWMRILQRADGTVVVTLTPPPAQETRR